MDETERWVAAYGPLDGPWLQAEFAHVMAGEGGIHSVRIARRDDAAEMARYREQRAGAEDPGQGEAADWEVTSPHTGIRYVLGCNW
jgi:hypothetical protein